MFSPPLMHHQLGAHNLIWEMSAETMPDRVRAGLIGCGHQARVNLLPGLAGMGQVELVACADVDEVNAHAAMEGYGFDRLYLDYDDMLSREELDAVVVATPHYLLKDAAIAAINKGCHVFVEKPMGVNKAEAIEIRDAARQAGVTATVGYCQRWAEGRLVMKDLIDRGAVGEIAHVSAGKGGPPRTGWLADPKQGGGQLLFLGVHITDQIRWMVGAEATRVYGEVQWHPETGADQNSAYTIRFDNNVLADVVCSQNVAVGFDFLEVLGSDGRIRAEWPSNVVHVESLAIPEFRHPTVIRPHYPERQSAEMFAEEMKAWVGSLTEQRDSPVPADDGVKVMEIIDAVFESARTGAPVDLS